LVIGLQLNGIDLLRSRKLTFEAIILIFPHFALMEHQQFGAMSRARQFVSEPIGRWRASVPALSPNLERPPRVTLT
jgi:hypothetical protein